MEQLSGWSEAAVRLASFAAIFAVMAVSETLQPRRPRRLARARRWPTNIAIVAIDSLLVRILAQLTVPLSAIAAALYAEQAGIGLLQAVTPLPAWLAFVAAVVALDFALWLQHLLSHRLPWLWRLHRVHHADSELDVTSALRFHPLEIALSVVWKMAWVLSLGAPVAAVLAFEIVLNGMAMFNHANLALPQPVDRVLRLLVVTPDMHRVHHSVLRAEHDANYGFNLSLWDRLFCTYVAEPFGGQTGMRIGLEDCPPERAAGLWWSLRLPWRDDRSGD